MSAAGGTPQESREVVIQGITGSGAQFRPSDWAERLCGMMSIFGEDRHLSYSPYLKPIMTKGLRCVVVDRELAAVDPNAFAFLMGFARDNDLQLRPGRLPGAGAPPAEAERREPDPAT